MKHAARHPLIFGTVLLTASGVFCRILGFVLRLFLSRMLGAEKLGIYQLVFPLSGLCFAICCGGFSTAISRLTAAHIRQPFSIRKHFLLAGLLPSLLLALCLSAILFWLAPFLATQILQETRCIPLLRILALSVPFSAAHACISGYFYGKKQAAPPAAAQVAEQILRVLALYLIWRRTLHQGTSFTPGHAMLALVFSEAASCLFLSLLFVLTHPETDVSANETGTSEQFWKPILRMAVPLSANRLLLTGLGSLEAILIPLCLKRSGLSSSDALSLYGILTGMVYPFLTFPSALTNSAAVLLLPEVAEAQASRDPARIRRTASASLSLCYCLGAVCTLLFLIFGRWIGTFFYSSETAGRFLVIQSWLCPFLYFASTAGSLLNGLGHTGSVLLHHLICAVIRLGFLWFIVPKLGIRGWLLGQLAAEIMLAALHLLRLLPYLRHSS